MAKSGDHALSPWAIVLRDGGAVVGHCGFLGRPVEGTTMGSAIVPTYRGRGLATEAAAVLGWAERHDIDVYASVRPPNPASVRVLEKIDIRLVDSYFAEDGLRDIYRRSSTEQEKPQSVREKRSSFRTHGGSCPAHS